MTYSYRKPKNAKEAIKLTKLAKVMPKWAITYEGSSIDPQKYFSMYEPIVFIYKNNKLIGAGHNKLGKPQVFDLEDRDITHTFNAETLSEIDVNIKQIELF